MSGPRGEEPPGCSLQQLMGLAGGASLGHFGSICSCSGHLNSRGKETVTGAIFLTWCSPVSICVAFPRKWTTYRVLEKEKRICKSVTYNILTRNNCLPQRCSIAPCVPDEIVNLNTPVTHPLPWSSSRSFHYELTSSRIPASSGLMWWGSHEGLDFTEDTQGSPLRWS